MLFAYASSASAVFTAAAACSTAFWYSVGSMTYSRSPFFTLCPSVKRRSITVPFTRPTMGMVASAAR